jgi:nitrogen fixation/metabolism regulation signal transduction histidine kinase
MSGLITDSNDDQSVIYNVDCRKFFLNGREHILYLYKNMTHEIARKESDMWKQVIRLISHELNNSLAPISSLTRSAQKFLSSLNIFICLITY